MNKFVWISGQTLMVILSTGLFVSLACAGSGRLPVQSGDQPADIASVGSSDDVPAMDADSSDYEYEPMGDLPDWIANFDPQAGDLTAGHRMLVKSDLVRVRSEATREMWLDAEKRVNDYLNEKIAPGAGNSLQVDQNFISHRLISHEPHVHIYRTPNPLYAPDNGEAQYLEWYGSSAEITLDRRFDEWAETRYLEHLVVSRVRQTGLLVLSGIALLGIVYGFLQLNHRTRGFYSGRLQTITLVAAVVIIAAALALSNSFAWL